MVAEFGDFTPLAPFGSSRPPTARKRPTIFPRGPQLYQLGTKPAVVGQGPGEPPPGFRTAHNSQDEWDFYWALSKVRGTPRDPRKPPFVGGDDWAYQVPESPGEGGFGIGRVAGGSVSDFVILGSTGKATVIRIQTERFHINTSANTQMRDLFIRDHLRGVERVVDVYSSDWLGDPSGNAVCRIAALACKGVELLSPIRYRTALRVRRPR